MVITKISKVGIGSEHKKIIFVEIIQHGKKFHYKIFREHFKINPEVYNSQIRKKYPLKINVVGEYFSQINYSHIHEKDDLSKDILLNKKKKEPDVAERLSLLMFYVAKTDFPEIFKVDIISPVPNTTSNKFDTKGPALSMQLFLKLKNNYPILHHELLNKIGLTNMKFKSDIQRIELFKNNRFYKFNKLFNIQDKTILLIDDVITLGCTTNQCLEELYNNGAKNVYIYAVAKNHFEKRLL